MVFTIGRLWEAGHNVGFIEDIWPFLEYSADLAQQDMSPIGAVAQNAGFQDDMVSWAFPRGRDPYGSFPGLTCSYWNMVWTRALELASGIANELGHPGAAENWSRLAGDIRHVIESQFWNGDLRRYAYFHDPEAATCYYGDLRFTAVSDGEIGQFVFPDPPLANGASLLHWCGYSDGPRATRCYELVRDRLLPLPDDLIIGPPFQSTLCDTSSQYHGADQSVSYARLLYAACEVGDTATAETLVDWLAKHIPLAGVPEVFPTGVRAVQLWPCGEMLIAFHHHLSDETSR